MFEGFRAWAGAEITGTKSHMQKLGSGSANHFLVKPFGELVIWRIDVQLIGFWLTCCSQWKTDFQTTAPRPQLGDSLLG